MFAFFANIHEDKETFEYVIVIVGTTISVIKVIREHMIDKKNHHKPTKRKVKKHETTHNRR